MPLVLSAVSFIVICMYVYIVIYNYSDLSGATVIYNWHCRVSATLLAGEYLQLKQCIGTLVNVAQGP